jgi:glycosyltransferase involved in cell wall biosynthesis
MFSVLLPIYYKENPVFLKQSLESIFFQTILPDEIVIVKDGLLTKELDNIIDSYVLQYPFIKIVALSENRGLGIALDEGLKHCKYELIARMDSDDIAKPNRFEKQLSIFSQFADIDIVSAWIDEFENDISNVLSTRKLPENHQAICCYTKSRCPINHPVVMFKKEAVINAGGYRPFPLLEDYYLWIRMIMNGCKFYNIQESLLFFRFSPDMLKRRGGRQYVFYLIKLYNEMKKLGFINTIEQIKNISVRLFSCILPNPMRKYLYIKILRKYQ